ncbi:MAG: tetratricopeptide repeat protein, partial [Anaerolineales bacterium]|nr:tetratricopeptide repeat protein [Anaerolineales bacterium]
MKKFIKTMTISLMLVFALTIVACQGETPAAEQEAIALEIENTIPAVTKTTQPPTPSPTSIKTSQELALTHVALGDAYIKDEAWNLAIDEYSLALELDVQAETCFKRGEAYRFLGDHELALEDYQQVVALDPQYAAAYLKQGEIYMMSAGYDDAIAMFEEVITLETADAAVYHQLGIAYFNRDQFDLALEAYNEALTLNTENASYY